MLPFETKPVQPLVWLVLFWHSCWHERYSFRFLLVRMITTVSTSFCIEDDVHYRVSFAESDVAKHGEPRLSCAVTFDASMKTFITTVSAATPHTFLHQQSKLFVFNFQLLCHCWTFCNCFGWFGEWAARTKENHEASNFRELSLAISMISNCLKLTNSRKHGSCSLM